jgi:uncharacterized protein (DUF885 family)
MQKNLLASALLCAGALIGVALPCSASTAPTTSGTPVNLKASASLHRLFDEFWETQMRESPINATLVGDDRFNDRLDDHSAASVVRHRHQTQDFLKRLRAIHPDSLSEADRVSRAVMLFQLDAIDHVNQRLDAGLEYGLEMPITPMSGPQFDLPSLVRATSLTRVRDYDAYLRRLEAMPEYVRQLTQILRTGMRSGWMPPRITLRNVPSQFDGLASADPSINPMAAPFASVPADFPAAERQRLEKSGKDIVAHAVAPAFAGLQAFLRDTYVPAARNDIAAGTLPGGPAYYAAVLQEKNTTTLTPQQIHDIGLSEVARIEAEMTKVQDKFGFKGTRADFLKYLWSDPRFFFDTPEAMLMTYRDIAKRIDPQLPSLFQQLPRLPYGIRPMLKEEGDNAEHYTPGTSDGARAGYFEANTNNLRRQARWKMTTLVLHEAVPGHHLQIARAQELTTLPRFQREGGNTAYVEGWALYAESLGTRLGMYDDPLDYYGHLGDEILRASRLVVDSGMHSLGWSRDQAIQYMRDHTPLSEAEIVAEIDRYIVWPGQATGYKIGQLRILALRDKAQKTLGDRFDIRSFHNAILDNGALPLQVLDEVIDRWIATQEAH